MYYFLTRALVDRIIEALRSFWASHPQFPDLVDNIVSKYSWEERPQRGIVVKVTGGSNVRLSANNFMGFKESFAYKALVKGFPGISLEFVREDHRAIQVNGGVFPTPPGLFYIEIVESELDAEGVPIGHHKFTVTPLWTEIDETVSMVDNTTGFLAYPFVPETLRLYELPSNFPLVEGVNFVADPETGVITLTEPLLPRLYLSADYRHLGGVEGPYDISQEHANWTAIPGVVMAFGRRITPGDKIAVLVSNIREVVAMQFGGRWDLSLDFDLWARDHDDQMEMADLTMTWLASVIRARLSDEGIEIGEISFGGETEEPYDDVGDDYFYGASLSCSAQTDWCLWTPLGPKIREVLPLTLEDFEALAASTTPEQLARIEGRLRLVERLGLVTFEDPYFTNQARRYQGFR